jgi:hypothetical protein
VRLDDLLGDDVEPAREPRGPLAARTFVLAVLAALLLVALGALLLWALGAGALAYRDYWRDGLA